MRKCRCHKCRVCPLRIRSATVRPLQSIVLHRLSVIRRSFFVVSWPTSKNWIHAREQGTFETVYFIRRTRLEEDEVCPIGQKCNIHRFLWVTISELHLQSGKETVTKTVIGLYYVEILGRFDAVLQKKFTHLTNKMCCSTMITHRLISPLWPNWYERYPIDRVLQIWLGGTSFCFQTWRCNSAGQILSRMWDTIETWLNNFGFLIIDTRIAFKIFWHVKKK